MPHLMLLGKFPEDYPGSFHQIHLVLVEDNLHIYRETEVKVSKYLAHQYEWNQIMNEDTQE